MQKAAGKMQNLRPNTLAVGGSSQVSASCVERRHHDRDQLRRLRIERINHSCGGSPRLSQKLNPVDALVCFFQDSCHLGNEVRFGFRSLSRTIVGSDGGSRPEQLTRQHPARSVLRQTFTKPYGCEGESLCACNQIAVLHATHSALLLLPSQFE